MLKEWPTIGCDWLEGKYHIIGLMHFYASGWKHWSRFILG